MLSYLAPQLDRVDTDAMRAAVVDAIGVLLLLSCVCLCVCVCLLCCCVCSCLCVCCCACACVCMYVSVYVCVCVVCCVCSFCLFTHAHLLFSSLLCLSVCVRACACVCHNNNSVRRRVCAFVCRVCRLGHAVNTGGAAAMDRTHSKGTMFTLCIEFR